MNLVHLIYSLIVRSYDFRRMTKLCIFCVNAVRKAIYAEWSNERLTGNATPMTTR